MSDNSEYKLFGFLRKFLFHVLSEGFSFVYPDPIYPAQQRTWNTAGAGHPIPIPQPSSFPTCPPCSSLGDEKTQQWSQGNPLEMTWWWPKGTKALAGGRPWVLLPKLPLIPEASPSWLSVDTLSHYKWFPYQFCFSRIPRTLVMSR